MIDAKAPLAQFDSIIDAGQKGDEERIKKLKTEFGKKIIDHIDWLSGRKYETAKNAEDYVLMFLPSAVHEQMARESVNLFQKDLDEYARNKKIYVVGPSTLTPYVQTASALWQMHENTIVAEGQKEKLLAKAKSRKFSHCLTLLIFMVILLVCR